MADVADVMGCSVGTVKSTLHDARRGLTDRLGGSYG
jgi:DNA-directed RNA polymerase specialized sigma24 family protein